MTKTLLDWLEEKPFSLALSSGFFGFYAHCGFLAALDEKGLRPESVSGSSAGALVGGIWSSGVSIDEMKRRLFLLKRQDFWDPKPGLGLLRGRLFRSLLDEMLNVKHIEQCKTPLAISVFNMLSQKTEAFAKGDMRDVIRASCAVPFLFQPVWLKNKPYFDGGIADRPGLKGMPEGKRVLYHHLISGAKWRKATRVGLTVPKRASMRWVAIENLPRPNPFKLHEGKNAFEHAYLRTKEILLAPLSG